MLATRLLAREEVRRSLLMSGYLLEDEGVLVLGVAGVDVLPKCVLAGLGVEAARLTAGRVVVHSGHVRQVLCGIAV